MSFAFLVHGVGDPPDHFTSNAARFATQKEAEAYGFDLGMRWFGFDDSKILESPDPVNARWDFNARRIVWESEKKGAQS